MKLVWIVNSMPAGFAAALAQPAPASGGWVSAQIEALAALPEMRLLVLCPAAGKTPRRAEANGVRYAEFPRAARPWRYSAAQERFFAELFAREKPDVVHLFGTEFPHTLGLNPNAVQMPFLLSPPRSSSLMDLPVPNSVQQPTFVWSAEARPRTSFRSMPAVVLM